MKSLVAQAFQPVLDTRGRVSDIFLRTFQVSPVGRESEAHPAFCIIPSLYTERYHLPPIPGYKYRFEHNDESLNKANPQPSSRNRALPDCSGCNQRDAHSHPRRGWRVPKSVAAKCLVLPSSGAALKVSPLWEFVLQIAL